MARRSARTLILPLLISLMPQASAASGETRLRAHYVASLAGITIGRGAWDVRLNGSNFTVAGHGGTSGLLRLFASGHGEATAEGQLQNGKPIPARYDYTATTRKKFDEIHMRLHDGNVTDLDVSPAQKPDHRRVPLEPQHQRGAFDPISAVLMPANTPPGSAIGPDACKRNVAVFDGRMRYELHFSFKQITDVKTEAGYQGPAAVCAFRFVPIAGHLPERASIKYLTALTTMEVWLAPIAGTQLVVPWRVVIPTPFGTGVLEAEQFEVSQNNDD